MSKSKISVQVRAGAHGDGVVGVVDGVLLVRVAAPAHEGRAQNPHAREVTPHELDPPPLKPGVEDLHRCSLELLPRRAHG